MNPSPRLTPLRYAVSRAYARHQQTTPTVTPGLHHLLPIPIRERLILLAKIDGATPPQIRRTIRCSQQDAEGTSLETVSAIELWQQTLDDAYWHVPTRSNWRHQKTQPVEKSLRQLLWSDVAVALIGDRALPELVSALPLRRRLLLYCLMVEEMRWTAKAPIFRLFGCTRWQVREAIRIGLAATQGGK